MKLSEILSHLNECFATEGDDFFFPNERETHNKAIETAINAIKALKAADVAFEMIRIQGYDVKLTPQAISAINEAMPLVAKVIYPDAIIEREPAVNAIERAKQTLRDAGYILAPLFCAEDVRGRAEDLHEIELTEEQVQEVCEAVENNSDCEIGVSWDSIDNAIQEVVKAN